MTSVDEMLETLTTTGSRPDQTWTTGNVAEAFPGVFTTFGLGFVFTAMEMAFRRMFYDLGVYSAGEIAVPENAEECFWAVFDGWAAGNIDKFRDIANRMPGTTASAVEQQLFGFVRPETVNENSFRRYPFILGKAPLWLMRTPKRHDALFAELRRWRLEMLPRIDDMDERACAATIADAQARCEDIMSIHMGVAMISSSLAEKVADLAEAAGQAGLEAALLSGVGSVENAVAHDLWALAHEQISLREFTERHGYHGPNEGQLSGVTWRQDPAPVLARIEDYRTIAADSPRAPGARSAAQEATRARALQDLLAGTPRVKRPVVAAVVKLTARYLALREQGKAGYLLTFDVARAAARRMGSLLVERGMLDDAEDVFHLRCDALEGGIGTDQRAVVARRAAQYRERQQIRLPKSWTGSPEVVKVAEEERTALAVGEVLTGVAASGGVTEGRARVVKDPDGVELDEGDILVCETTDPAWVPLFLVAGGVITDHGGLLSHGPIVARELGIPCVCGTEDGSRRILDGQIVRIDGDRGTVEVIDGDRSLTTS
ncbi:PEP-utilizing enzyme [Mycolicibacterium sp.]|uniref:PEP-utilizing enzyme n=1 Tax=Mycolicibacterium sp. TaxID=2320850 RepID=UPI00355EE035